MLTFTPSVTEWCERTNAIGIYSKMGKYGGTYAYKDIAFEFASAISPSMIGVKLIINVGTKKVIYANKYPDEEAFKILKEAGVKTQYFEINKIKEVI